MRIIEIELSGYRRFLSGGTKKIVYAPQSAIQLITANNGAGKSSLLAELSPLPAQQGHFIKGGYKKITIEHRNHQYVLTSDFSKGNHHYFEKDGVNLNTGRTGSVQKILVEQEFAYTAAIHDLQLGRIKFTALTASRRREVLTLLCRTDVTYAMELYARLATQARNIVGAKKHTEEKIIQHRSSLVDEAELFDIQTRLTNLQNEYLLYSQSKYRDLTIVNLERIADNLTRLTQDLKTHVDKLPYGFFTGVDLENEVRNKELDLARIQNQIAQYTSEHNKLTDILNEIYTNDSRSLDELLVERESLVLALEQYVKPDIPVMEYDAVLRSALEAANGINDLLLKMPTNPNMELYSRNTVPAARQRKEQILILTRKANHEIELANTRLDTITEHQKNECPQCGYTWIPGLSEKEIANLEKVIVDAEKALELLKPELATVDEFLTAADLWALEYSRLKSMMSQYPRLTQLWDYLYDNHRVFNEPASAVGWINRFIELLQTAIAIEKIANQITSLDNIITVKRKSQSHNSSALQTRLVELEKIIESNTQDLELLKVSYQADISKLRLSNFIITQVRNLHQAYNNYALASISNNKLDHNRAVDSVMSDLTLQIGLLSDKVEKAKHSLDLLAHLDLSLKELTEDEQIYALLLKELSPTEGLIAQTLFHFIQILVNQINEVIRSIWTTRLHVHPCSMENDQLNYMFPLEFIEADHPVSDISEGSEGQQDIIDFAFKLVARVHLGLQEYPMLMDEVGRSFHEHHRLRLFEYIKKLIEVGLTQQVFVVSHFPSTHGTLTLADRNVLDPTGVMVLPTDNQYFKIT